MFKKKWFRRSVYALIVFFSVILIAGAVFYTLYLDGFLNGTITPKLNDAVVAASNGKYGLKIGNITYRLGVVLCERVELQRLKYDSTDNGLVVRRLAIDTVSFSGIDWWKLIFQKGLYLSNLKVNTPKIFMIDAGTHDTTDIVKSQKPVTLPSQVPVVAIDHIDLNNILIYLPERSHPKDEPSFKNMSFHVSDFFLNDLALKTRPLFFSKRVEFALPSAYYPLKDSLYTLEAQMLQGNLSDSVLTIDTLAYVPNYSEEAFQAKFRYRTDVFTIRFTGIQIRGIDFTRLLTGEGIVFRAWEAKSWYLDYFKDCRFTPDPHEERAVLPNELLRNLHFVLDIDSMTLNDGAIFVRQRQQGAGQLGVLNFARTRVTAIGITNDSMSPKYHVPARFLVHGSFVNEAELNGEVSYPLDHTSFDLSMKATVGGFSPKSLNKWMMPVERKEIVDGMALGGDVSMRVVDGNAYTDVTPRYRDLRMNVLATKSKESRGILEGIKTFIANTFILRSNNLDTPSAKAVSGITRLKRLSTQQFFEFIWISLRKSIGKVLGGFG